jgi:hypothetical protein
VPALSWAFVRATREGRRSYDNPRRFVRCVLTSNRPAERDVIPRRPRRPTESMFDAGLGMHALLVGLLMAAVYVLAFNALLKTVPLRLEELASCIGAAVITLAVVETEKGARRRRSVTG